jgi:CoA:oxalate CoA-transferase
MSTDDPRTRPGRPLDGVVVIDLTTFLSGPFASQILVDLGADVIKVEPPGGDSSRHIPPHFVDGDSAYYLSHNAGKRSICLDLKTPSGQEILRKLIGTADVVLENFRPGVSTRLGIDPANMTAEHPRLVWASISGFGQTGPRSHLPAYDMIVQALSCVMSLTGEPERPPVRLGIPAGDLIAGMYAVIGLLASLVDVRRGQRGRIIDISMLDSMLSMLSYQASYTLLSGVAPPPQAAQHDSIPTYRSFEGSDGKQFVITANTEAMWVSMCRAAGQADLLDDDRYSSPSKRLANKTSLWCRLESRFAEHSAEHWVTLLTEANVPAALVKSVPDALADARDSERHILRQTHDPVRGTFESVGSPIMFVGAERQQQAFPPRLGQDGEAILRAVGYTDDDIDRLVHDRVVRLDLDDRVAGRS